MPHRSTAGVEEGFGAYRPIVWKAHGSESLFVIPIQVEVAAFPRRGVVFPVSFGLHPSIEVDVAGQGLARVSMSQVKAL